jgi:alkylation response protein AidB-like acyl-CoA dehydrogenase
VIDVASVRAFLDDGHPALAERVARFAEETLRPLAPADDDRKARHQAREILALLGEAGWGRYAVPARHGGASDEIDLRACCLIRETLAATSPLADAVFALQCLGSMPVALAGSERLQEHWLPQVAAGEAMTAFAMSEPEAGSDVGGIVTRAARDGDDYVLDGRKHLISNAGIADLYVVFALTEPGAGSRGLTAFAVPAATQGLSHAAPQVMSVPHPLGEIAFDGARVPVDWRLGKEGEGFKLGMRTLDRLRATVAAAACGMAARALDEALAHARRRRQFGKSLSDFQLVQAKLATMATELAAARLLTYRAAWAVDGGAERVTRESAMAKAWATEAAQRIVDQAVQIVGGRGVLADHPVDHLYRSVRALRIYEGATEIQQLVIARELLRDGGG